MTTQTMLDNAATASQSRELLEPVTRGAILRSFAQWIENHHKFDPFYHGWIVDELLSDPEATS